MSVEDIWASLGDTNLSVPSFSIPNPPMNEPRTRFVFEYPDNGSFAGVDFDFDIQVTNVTFSPDINNWVCYRRNLFSAIFTVYGRPPADVTAHIHAFDKDGPVPLCTATSSRKADSLTQVNPLPLVDNQVSFHHLQFRVATSHNNLVGGRMNPKQQFFRLAATLSTPAGVLVQKVSPLLVVRGGHPGRFKTAAADAQAQEVQVTFEVPPLKADLSFDSSRRELSSPPAVSLSPEAPSADPFLVLDTSDSPGFSSPPVHDFGNAPAPPLVLHGRVGINEEDPQHELVVRGDIQYTGNLIKQSDQRLKENFRPVDSEEQLERLKKVQLYDYNYREEFDPARRQERGVIAQELQQVIPEAVKETTIAGKTVLAVDRDRLQMEAIGATKAVAEKLDGVEDRVEDLESQPRTVVNIVNLYAGQIRSGCMEINPYMASICLVLFLLSLAIFVWSLAWKDIPLSPPSAPLGSSNTPTPTPTPTTSSYSSSHHDEDHHTIFPTTIPPSPTPLLPQGLQYLIRWSAGVVAAILFVGWIFLAFCIAARSRSRKQSSSVQNVVVNN